MLENIMLPLQGSDWWRRVICLKYFLNFIIPVVGGGGDDGFPRFHNPDPVADMSVEGYPIPLPSISLKRYVRHTLYTFYTVTHTRARGHTHTHTHTRARAPRSLTHTCTYTYKWFEETPTAFIASRRSLMIVQRGILALEGWNAGTKVERARGQRGRKK